MLQYIISFIILISVVVFIHEYGHYYFAKKYKVGVTDFSIGFGKELYGFNDKYGTRWKICAIPLGGYVKFFGDSNSASQPSNLSSVDKKDHSKLLATKPLYQRAIIVSAGPFANFILAIFIFSIIFMTVGKDVTMPVITEVQKNSPAAEAGLKSKDQITYIDGKEIKSINDVALFISISEGDNVKVEVSRNHKPLSFLIKPEIKLTKDNFGNSINRKLIGIKIAPVQGELKRETVGPAKALVLSVKETYNTVSMTLSYIGKIIVGRESADQLGGPIKIAQISGKVAEHGLIPFLSIMAYISISLGLINLFPIPLLDGGHLFFYLIEFLRGKPLSENVQVYFYKFGMAILLTLMVFATFNDLKSLGLF